ncbi:MAG: hypothetical protein HWN68_08175 [Desulfobacterales bacterium]|nr:hypothetical protein [Desulfobacterales bacterium]
MTMEQQIAESKQKAAQTGFGGSAIIDVNPATGIIRMKIKTNSPERLKPFMGQYPQILAMSLTALNIEVKVHVAQEG